MSARRTHEPIKAAESVDEDLLRTLPPVLRAIVRSLGFARAREFLLERGGTPVYISKGYGGNALGLSAEELARLQQTLAPHMDDSRRVFLPKADKLLIRARDIQIRLDKKSASISGLALRNRLSTRQILNICREDKDENDPQFGLF